MRQMVAPGVWLDRGPQHPYLPQPTIGGEIVRAAGYCAAPLCYRDILAIGLCVGHYSQLRRGLELRPLRRRAA